MKVGDKVKTLITVGGDEDRVGAGTIGIITEIDIWGHPYKVEFDDIYYCYSESEIQLVESAKPAQKVYKIRRKSDGLFSSGGSAPHFTNKGKTWSQKGHVTSHINMLGKYVSGYYSDCEIVEYELNEVNAKDIV